MKPTAVTTITMAPNYDLFYGVEIATLCIAVVCFTLRLSNRIIKIIFGLVGTMSP